MLNQDISDEKLWESYYDKHKENALLKTFSEAIAGTVGSVRTLAQARFRYLEPVNFAGFLFGSIFLHSTFSRFASSQVFLLNS